MFEDTFIFFMYENGKMTV